MRVTKKSIMLMLALIALVSCGGGGGGSSSNAPTPVNMEINLKGDVSKVPIGQLDSSRFTTPQLPGLVREQFEDYRSLAGGVSYPLTYVENDTFGDGDVVFRIENVNDTNSLESQVKNEFNSYNLHNLTANMQKGSTLLLVADSNLSLSKIKEDLFADFSAKPTINGNKNDYNQIIFINGEFKIDKNVNLDSANDMFNRIKIYDSDITNLSTIKGTLNNQVGIGQRERNDFIINPSVTFPGNKLINRGTINLSGSNSIGIFNSGWKIAGIQNIGDIIVNKNSTGIYVLDKKNNVMQHGTGNIENEGNIKIGENSIGIYYESEGDYPGYKFNANILNKGTIKSTENGAIGIYHNSSSPANKAVKNTGLIELTGDKSLGMYAAGTGEYDAENSGKIVIGNSFNKGNPGIGMYSDNENILLNNTGTISLGKDSIGMYGVKSLNNINGKIELAGKGAVGIYVDENTAAVNAGTITTTNVDGGSLGVVGIKDSEFLNNGTISVNEGSVGVYGNGNNAILKNEGIISVGRNSVGMYSAKGATVENNKTIKLVGDDSIGMYVADNSKGINNGEITTDGIVNRAIGVALGKNAEFTNNGKIVINSNEGIGIVNAGGIIKNYGDIQVIGDNSLREKRVDNVVIKTDGVMTPMSYVQKAPTLGLYVDTEGKTNPIKGIEKLGVSKVDLLIGAEAANSTNDTTVEVSKEVLKPYSNTIEQVGLNNVSVKSGALTWNLESETSNKGIKKAILTKKSYVVFTGDTEIAKLAQGLDERYRLSALGSEERQLFTYLNSLGPNDKNLLEKAFKEISGNQYINTQRRIKESSAVLDKEISDLYKEFDYSNETGSKIKTFVNSGKYDTNIDGIYDYKNQGYGIAYVYNNSDKKYGITAGAGANTYKLKDDGKSKEKINMLKVGAYKTFELGNAADWTLSGNGFYGRNEMERRYIVGNNEYSGKADYDVYGFGMRNEISKKVRLGNNFVFKPYTALNTEYGKFENIKEKDGALRLEVKGNDYYSIKPEAGVEFNIEKPVFKNSKIKASFSTGYEYELGKVDNLKNKARLVGTSGQWYELRKSKEEDKGNLKADVKVGFETGNFGITLNGGYDTNGKNVRGGLGIKASF